MSKRELSETRIALPALEAGDRVHLVFHPRASLARWQSSEGLRGLRWSSHRSPNVATLEATDSAPSQTVVVFSEGPAQLVDRRVTTRARPDSSRRLTNGADGAPENDGDHGVAASPPDSRQYLDELWTILEAAPQTPLWNYRRFFADLDRHTDPNLRRVHLTKTSDTTQLDRVEIHEPVVRTTLWDRMSHRHADPAHAYSRPSYPGAAVVQEDVRFISDLILRLLHRYVSTPAGLLDLRGVHDAFEMFANGELRLQLPCGVWTTQPSSGLFFFFGEFALLAAECGVQAELWTRIAGAMIGAQPILGRVYAPSAGITAATTLDNYLPDAYAAGRVFTAGEKEALRKEYAGRTLDELCIAQALHLERFARGSLPRSGAERTRDAESDKLGAILAGLGVWTDEQRTRALQLQETKNAPREVLGSIAVKRGLISPAQLRKALGLQVRSRRGQREPT